MKIAGGAHVADHTWTKTMINLARRIHLKQKKIGIISAKGNERDGASLPSQKRLPVSEEKLYL